MQEKWRRFWLFHGAVLGLALLFAVYGRIATTLFPNQNFYHCFVHDVLRLYCPFCGFTRGFQALLRLQLLMALRLNPAVLLAACFYAALDIRALVLLCRGNEQNLVPRFVLPASIVWFGGYAVLQNTLLLFGVDPVGDQLAFWSELALWRSICGTLVLAVAMGAFLFLLNRLYHRRRRCLVVLLPVLLAALTLFLAVLYVGT